MFVHKQHLEYLLSKHQYYSAEQHELEMERLFKPAWHLVGTWSDVPTNGDFVTLDLLGEPLLVRNIAGEIHTFLNVCSHRHCLLTHEQKGHDAAMRCQYHGWEYQASGRTARIPDAQIFRPMDRERATLSKFRTALCGELIFVCLADDGPSLSDWLSPHYETYVQWFATDSLYRQIWEWDADFDCNWKIPIENTLESYHVNQLHPTTLQNYPREEAVRHELHERYTVHDCETEFPQYRRQVESLSRLLGSPATHMYRHHHVHPHVVITSHDLWRIAQVYVPTSRTKCWMRLKLFAYQGGRRGFIGNLIRRRLRRVLPLQLQAVTREDISVYADVQRGIRSSRYRGIIGTREERIHTFHRYLLKACGLASPQIESG